MAFGKDNPIIHICLFMECATLNLLQQYPTNAHVYALIKYIQKIAGIANRTITVHATCIPSSHAALKIVH